MKKIFMLTMLSIFFYGICLANNEVRIKELQDENTKLSTQIQQAQTYIQQAQVALIKNQGAIDELTKMDEKEKAITATEKK